MPRIAEAVQLAGPSVAARPEDKWVLTVAGGILVVTSDGRVFGHQLSDTRIRDAVQLSAPKTAANPQDRWVDWANNYVTVITESGRVFVHRLHIPDESVFVDVFPDRVEDARELPGPDVAANLQDKWVSVYGGRIFVITDDGSVFVHPLHPNGGVPDRVEDAFQLAGPPVAANAQDKWVLISNSRIYVITEDGSVFMHSLTADAISAAKRLDGPPVAAHDADRWVLAWDDNSRLVVITDDGRVFAHALVPTGSEIPR